jgi:putative oxidoreductase
MDKLNPYLGLAGRVLLAITFVVAGYGKFGGYAGTQGYMEAMGVPGMLLPLVIILELGGGLAIIAGWQTRIIAILLAGFTLLAAFMFHLDFADRLESIWLM